MHEVWELRSREWSPNPPRMRASFWHTRSWLRSWSAVCSTQTFELDEEECLWAEEAETARTSCRMTTTGSSGSMKPFRVPLRSFTTTGKETPAEWDCRWAVLLVHHRSVGLHGSRWQDRWFHQDHLHEGSSCRTHNRWPTVQTASARPERTGSSPWHLTPASHEHHCRANETRVWTFDTRGLCVWLLCWQTTSLSVKLCGEWTRQSSGMKDGQVASRETDSGVAPRSDDPCWATVVGCPGRVANLVRQRISVSRCPGSASAQKKLGSSPCARIRRVRSTVMGSRNRHPTYRRQSLWNSSSGPKTRHCCCWRCSFVPGGMALVRYVAKQEWL